MSLEKRPRKSYTREYKLNAVRLTIGGDASVAQMARDLGLNKNTLHNWRRQYRQDEQDVFPGKGKLKPADDELRQLRRECQTLRDEVKFLKRAAVWLAREAHGSTE
jgi:transposase